MIRRYIYTHTHRDTCSPTIKGLPNNAQFQSGALTPHLTLTNQQGRQQFTAHASPSPWTTDSTGSLVKFAASY